jgi:hypothetical protein
MRYLKNKLCWVTILTFVLSLSQFTLFAQDDGPGGLPGDGGGGCDPFLDPDCTPDSGDAPLDNWVFLLVFLVLALTIWYYYKQKKSLRSL